MNLPADVDILKEAKRFIWRHCGVLDTDKTNEIVTFVTDQETKFGNPSTGLPICPCWMRWI